MAKRISKSPQERKTELLDAAEELFIQTGYEQTAIRDIISKVGVAHGLFYYYFSSKEDILTEIIDRYYMEFLRELEPIVAQRGVRGIDLFIQMSDASLSIKRGKEKFFSYISATTDPVLQERLSSRYRELIAPVITSIVEKGVCDGSFDTEYPPEAVAAIHAIGTALFAPYDTAHAPGSIARRMGAYIDFVERILGINNHALREYMNSPDRGTQKMLRAFEDARTQEEKAHECD